MLNENQICLITGASHGIGKGIAQVMAEEGATVILAARRLEKLETLAAELRGTGASAEAVALDVTDRAAVCATVDRLVTEHGRIDILVNNAGLMPMPMALTDTPDEEWDAMFATNITGAFNMIKAVLPGMQRNKFGRIVNTSSISAKYTWPQFVAYAASKGGLHAMTTALAKEVAADGITVNAILPGLTRTEEMERIWGQVADAAGMTLDALIDPILAEKVPLKRWIMPREIGYMVSFLASRRADGITGHLHAVDGGLDAHD